MISRSAVKGSGYSWLVLPVLLIVFSGSIQTAATKSPSEAGPAPDKILSQMVLPGTQDLQLVIELPDPPTVEHMQSAQRKMPVPRLRESANAKRLDLQSIEAITYRKNLTLSQNAMIKNLSAMEGVQILGSVDTVMNAVMVRAPISQYGRIRRMSGIKKVYFSRLRKILLDTSAAIVNAQQLWTQVGGKAQAGKGIKIGIIDTGIDISNPMFSGSSFSKPTGYPKGDSTYTGTYSNNKVIAVRNYVQYFPDPTGQTELRPIDEVGHGSFVAGVAAGNETSAPRAVISGMAPGAYLGNYKIFGTPGINDSTTTDAIIAAVEDAVKDGMDVINLSLGALDYLLPSEDPEIAVIENAINAGVVVVVAAGNDGSITHTIGNPAGAPDAIAVGAVTNSRTFASQVHVTAPAPVPTDLASIAYEDGDGPITTVVSSTTIVDVETIDGNGFGCASLPSGSLSGKIAFIERGGTGTACTFATKASNATAAGAAAALVYNNVSGADAISMGGLSSTAIRAVMISNTKGVALKAFIAANPGRSMASIDDANTLVITPTTPRVLASFSAVGPAPDFGIKPDLVAVGVNVYSAAQNNNSNGALYDSSRFTISQGTSFSAPMVAGAAAALLEIYPSFTPLEIKSLLTSTASRDVTTEEGNAPNILQAGSGLLDMGSAAAAGAVFSPTNLNFGVQSYTDTFTLIRTLTIKNTSSASDQFTISFEPIVAGPALTLSQNATGFLSPGGTAGINVTLQISPPLSGGFQGFIVVQSSTTSSIYRIPYWAGLYVPDSSRILTVSKSASGTDSFSDLDTAVMSANPDNIVEIADSGTYLGGLTIATNNEGLPLHGLVIRADAGQTPVIDGTDLGSQPNIQVIAAKNVLFQGLTVSGGSWGIYTYQPSVLSPLIATIDQCVVKDQNESSAPVGIVAIGGGTVEITKSEVSGSGWLGVYAGDSSYLTLDSSTVSNSGYYGIYAGHANAQILNSTVSGNSGAGFLCYSCSGTIESSIFSANLGSVYGDGVDIIDGNMMIRNNTFSANDSAGIYLSRDGGGGSNVSFTNNTVKSNLYGIDVRSAENFQADGNLIKDNGLGAYLFNTTSAVLSNNIIARSNDLYYGIGVDINGAANVRLVNDTIYKNASQGILVESTLASVSIFNSIISSNSGGDLQGVKSGQIQYSLIGDNSSFSQDHNITGDPKFVDPGNDNFALAANSPALDTGSNSAPNLPFLDFAQHLRVSPAVTGSALPGQGVVDMGALELNSYYPLVFPLTADGTQPTLLNNNYATGIAILNYGTLSNQTIFAGYDPSGNLLSGAANPSTINTVTNAQPTTLSSTLFGLGTTPSLGSILASSLEPMAGFFLIFDSNFTRFANGISVSDQTSTDLLLMRQQNDSSGPTRFVLSNPGPNAANITATLYSASGSAAVTPVTATIDPRGQSVLNFDSVSGTSGYLRVQSDRPITGMELYGDAGGLATLAAVSPGTEARLFFPEFAVNAGYTTQIGLINTASAAANVVLTAYYDEGIPIASPVSITLAANAQLIQSASDLFGIGQGGIVTGYIIALSDQPGIQGYTAYIYNDGTHRSAAATIVDSTPSKRLLFSHVANQIPAQSGGDYLTGIALLNPYGTSIDYTIKLYDGDGDLIAQKIDTLAPRQKVAKLLSYPEPDTSFFTSSTPIENGHVEVTSSYGLVGYETFFNTDMSQLASVPPQTGD
jgi:minor extracellular serine protease Vpr